MAALLFRVGVEVITWAAFLRCVWVLSGLVHMFKRARTGSMEWDLPFFLGLPEPFLLAAVTYWLRASVVFPVGIGSPELLPVLAGALVSILGFALSQWAFYSYRTVGTGHYVDPEHEVITHGAYSLARHPLYLGVFLLWGGLALGFGSLAALLLIVCYVVPVYLLYMRSEEAMMERRLGEAYRSYQREVPMILPHLWHHR
jgi:protein-S-isoprenylcysteine O-methyltransferase Ste14